MKVLYVDAISTRTAADFVRGMMKAYRRIATLKPFPYRQIANQYGVTRMNEMLTEAALEFQPNLIHLGKCESVRGSAIKAIKEQLDTYVIQYYGDFRWGPQSWIVDIGRWADCTILPSDDLQRRSMYEKAGVKHVGPWWGPGVDPEVFSPRGKDKLYDIVFAGTNIRLPHKGYADRRQLLEMVLGAGFRLDVFGGTDGWRYLRGNIHLHPYTLGSRLAEIYSRSLITLGINGVNSIRMYASWERTLNSMASGSLHLTHYVPGIETFFENGKDLVWFHSIPEAIELIEYYLVHEDEREKIAAAGSQKVLAHHTWDDRIRRLMEIMLNRL